MTSSLAYRFVRRHNIIFTTDNFKNVRKNVFHSKKDLREIVMLCSRWTNLKEWFIFSIFYCVLESKYIHAGSDLLLNILLSVDQSKVYKLLALVIYPL